jgi:DNA mismatch repair protein MutS
MSFTTDKQTLTDLDIFGKKGRQSVYGIFNHTQTNGGAQLLEEMFRYPLSDDISINQRSEMIRFIHSLKPAFPVQPAVVDAAEKYLDNTDSRSQLTVDDGDLRQKVRSLMGSDPERQLLIKGIEALVVILHSLSDFSKALSGPAYPHPPMGEIRDMRSLLENPRWKQVFDKQPDKRLSFQESAELDKLFRFTNREQIKQLLRYLYAFDVYIAVAGVAEKKDMAYAVASIKGQNAVILTAVYHPFLKNPVPNSIHISKDRNIVFLTGANMAGKSTFMKSVGIALFLAHMGFPVPAEKMEFSVFDGILTTINLSDNLNSGYSHFYSEVLRVKKMAEQVKLGKNVFIIFDELFRGTNVKDAYEATVAITGALTKKSNCLFIVSTHIMEAGETLKQNYQHINFIFLPTKMNSDKPVYTYQLEQGISDDRHGMLIIRNEHILDLLKKSNIKSA